MRFKKLLAVVCLAAMFGLEADASVQLAQYKGLHYNEVEKHATDEEVKSIVDAQFSSTTEYEQITDRKVAGFDKVNVDYEVYCGGEEVEEKRRCIVALGSEGLGRIFDVLIGVAPGESKEIASNLPDDWSDETVAGESVLFEVTVNAICGDAIAQVYDDNWVKSNTEFSTVAEYESSIRDSIESKYKEQFDKAVHDDLVTQIISNSVFDSNEVADSEYAEAVNNYKDYAEAEGLDYDEFIKSYLGVSSDAIEETIKTDILYNKQLDEAFSKIAENEGISVSNDEWEEYLHGVTQDYGYDDPADLENDLEDDAALKKSLEQECLNQLVYNWVLESAVNDAEV